MKTTTLAFGRFAFFGLTVSSLVQLGACIGDDPGGPIVGPADASADATPSVDPGEDAAGGADALGPDQDVDADPSGSDADVDADAILDADVDADAIVDAGADAPAPDAGADAQTGPPCDLTKPFGTPVAVSSLNTPGQEQFARLSADELVVYFSSDRDKDASASGAFGGYDLYVATRTSRSEPFGMPTRLPAPILHDAPEVAPSETADRRTLYFDSYRNGNDRRIFRATRATAQDAWGTPVEVTELTSANEDGTPYVLPGGDALYFFTSRDSSNFNLYRVDLGLVIPRPSAVPGVNSSDPEYAPVVTADERTIYFASVRAGGLGSWDVWVATRATKTGSFSDVKLVENVNSANQDIPTWISPDGCRLYLASDRPGGSGKLDIYVAERPK